MTDPTPLTEPTRVLPLTGVANFRDLGGYPTIDGGTTRWGTVFRADGLHQLTDDDVEVLRGLPLRTVIDLRTPDEVSERGRYPVEAHPVTLHHLSVLDRTWDIDEARRDALPPAEFLHQQYRTMLRENGERYAAALTLVADRESAPVVFHCAAGKDRTGLLAALVLGSVGVPRRWIVEDFALTSIAMDRIMDEMRKDPERAAFLAEVPTTFFSADPVGMDRTLADVEDEHGSIRDYLRQLGVADDTLGQLAELLVDRP